MHSRQSRLVEIASWLPGSWHLPICRLPPRSRGGSIDEHTRLQASAIRWYADWPLHRWELTANPVLKFPVIVSPPPFSSLALWYLVHLEALFSKELLFNMTELSLQSMNTLLRRNRIVDRWAKWPSLASPCLPKLPRCPPGHHRGHTGICRGKLAKPCFVKCSIQGLLPPRSSVSSHTKRVISYPCVCAGEFGMPYWKATTGQWSREEKSGLCLQAYICNLLCF